MLSVRDIVFRKILGLIRNTCARFNSLSPSLSYLSSRNGDKYVMSPQHTTILAGSEKNSEGGMEYLISKIFVHPKYNPERTDYDLSIVAVERDIVFSQTVQPVGLPLDSWEDHIGEEGIVSGFGRTTVKSFKNFRYEFQNF